MIHRLRSEVEKVELRIAEKARESQSLTCLEWVLAFGVGGGYGG